MRKQFFAAVSALVILAGLIGCTQKASAPLLSVAPLSPVVSSRVTPNVSPPASSIPSAPESITDELDESIYGEWVTLRYEILSINKEQTPYKYDLDLIFRPCKITIFEDGSGWLTNIGVGSPNPLFAHETASGAQLRFVGFENEDMIWRWDSWAYAGNAVLENWPDSGQLRLRAFTGIRELDPADLPPPQSPYWETDSYRPKVLMDALVGDVERLDGEKLLRITLTHFEDSVFPSNESYAFDRIGAPNPPIAYEWNSAANYPSLVLLFLDSRNQEHAYTFHTGPQSDFRLIHMRKKRCS